MFGRGQQQPHNLEAFAQCLPVGSLLLLLAIATYPVNACKQLFEVWLNHCQAGTLAKHLQQVIITQKVEPARQMNPHRRLMMITQLPP